MDARELEDRIAEIEDVGVMIDMLNLRGAILSWELSHLMADEATDANG